MDIKSDMENGIHSFPSRFGERATTRTSIQLSLLWFACFAISNPIEEVWFLIAAGIMCALNIGVVLFRERLPDFQTALFRVSMLTGWVLLASIIVSDSSEIERFASGM
jgi:4-hydroxybenzoate polyprenyltransferase